MLLRDVLLPQPMRPDWVEEMEWPYPGVPVTLVAEFAGHRVAGLPFFAPETVTSDHGSVYKNHQIVQVARTLRMEWFPARAMRPTDKAACERAFAGIQSLLLELLLGFRGVDVADRGVDPEGGAVWTLEEMEHLLATWVVGCGKIGDLISIRLPGTRGGDTARTRCSPLRRPVTGSVGRSPSRVCTTNSCRHTS
ncbi:hypothetical protein ACIPQ3_19835 [Streptomyces albidoflavus]